MRILRGITVLVAIAFVGATTTQPVRGTGAEPFRAKQHMVISANGLASQAGSDVMADGGNAIDAAVATAFALAVVHPTAGNIGGGGFIVFRDASGASQMYDFREMAPPGSSPTMWLEEGKPGNKYSSDRHHLSYLSVGTPGTVAGLHMAWKERGKLPWKRLVDPAVKLARDGFVVSPGLARSLANVLKDMRRFPASVAAFSKNGVPYEAGEVLKQPDLGKTLDRIGRLGPAGFYEGETAALIDKEMRAHGGLVTSEALKAYRAVKRDAVKGTYCGYDIVSVAPPSGGGIALIEMLNILEGYDLNASGYGSAKSLHPIIESMRRAFADRAQHSADPDFNPNIPVARLISKPYADELRKTINPKKASVSAPDRFTWRHESDETTHLSIVDKDRNAVSMTYTLEYGYGSRIVVPGAGFLLNNELGDFNAGPGLTDATGLVGTEPNLAQPGKRPLSSMTPTIVAKDGRLFMVTGSPGGRTIINTALHTILNVVDYKMGAQDAVDGGRFHHQWLPDTISYERNTLSPDTIEILKGMGHTFREGGSQGVAEVILDKGDWLEGGIDHRQNDGGAAGR